MNTRDPRTFAIIGAAMEVHRQLGRGFLEAIYCEAMGLEMEIQTIPFAAEVQLPIYYKERLLDTTYRMDFVCYGEIIVEVKALNQLSGVEEAQILNYLKATRFQVGLLLNFGAGSLEYKRYANSRA